MGEEIVLNKKITFKDDCFYLKDRQVKLSDIKYAGISRISDMSIEDLEFITKDDYFFFISNEMNNYQKVKEIIESKVTLCDLFDLSDLDIQSNGVKVLLPKEDDTSVYHTFYITQRVNPLLSGAVYITIDGDKTFKLYKTVNSLELKIGNHNIKIWIIVKGKVKVLFNENIEMNEDKFSYISNELIKDYVFKITDVRSLEMLDKKAKGAVSFFLLEFFLMIVVFIAIIIGIVMFIAYMNRGY